MDCVKVKTNWYWGPETKQYTIIISTRTIDHPSLYVVILIYFKSISRNICNKYEAWKAVQRRPIFITYLNHNYFIDNINRRYNIEYERVKADDEENE